MKKLKNVRNSALIFVFVALALVFSCISITFADDNIDPLPDNPQDPVIEQGFTTDDQGNTYYYDENLQMVRGWLLLDSSRYYFDTKSGAMQTGWNTIEGKKYFFDTNSGKMFTGWHKIKGSKYYFGKDSGKMFTGWHKINGAKYFFGKDSGKMFTGWHKINGARYFFGKDSGKMFTGWHKINSSKYFFGKNSGKMFTGWHKIDGHKYYFDKKNGHMYKGWHKIGKNKYYFNKKNGRMFKGLHKIGNYKYYFSKKSGKMMKGLRKIGKDVYNIDSKGRVKRVIYGNKKAICLTYDDGPANGTQLIVDTLKANDAAATFFVVGNRAYMYSDALKNAVSIGCQMASHTYQHKMLGSLDASGIQWQMKESIKSIKKYSGQTPVICRTPGGELGSTIQANVGMPIILWSIDTLDWKTQSADSTYNAVINGAYDGAVVLMHDLWDSTASASTRIIPELKRRGYQMVTIEEMALLKGKTLKAGQVYYGF